MPKPGSEFIGWTDDDTPPVYTGIKKSGTFSMPDRDVELQAQWASESLSIGYDFRDNSNRGTIARILSGEKGAKFTVQFTIHYDTGSYTSNPLNLTNFMSGTEARLNIIPEYDTFIDLSNAVVIKQIDIRFKSVEDYIINLNSSLIISNLRVNGVSITNGVRTLSSSDTAITVSHSGLSIVVSGKTTLTGFELGIVI